MTDKLRKEAIELLLSGATLLSEPCPYCKGVRVMKDGLALCVSCGKKPKNGQKIESNSNEPKNNTTLTILENKLKVLSKELENENDPPKQQDILKSINSLIDVIEKLKN